MDRKIGSQEGVFVRCNVVVMINKMLRSFGETLPLELKFTTVRSGLKIFLPRELGVVSGETSIAMV